MRRYLLLPLLLTSVCFAQPQKPVTKAPAKPRVTSCTAERAALKEQLEAQATRIAELEALNAVLSPSNTVITNEDVLRMLKAGISSADVLDRVMKLKCQCDTSPAALERLRAAAVPNTVILALQMATAPAARAVKTVTCEDGHGLCFQTPAGTTKRIAELKVSDLPSSGEQWEMVKCMTLADLAADNGQKNGAVAESVPEGVLSAIPSAAAGCLVLDLQLIGWRGMRENAYNQVTAMVDATVEIDRRRYNGLVADHNSLVASYNSMRLQATRLQQQIQADAAANRSFRDALLWQSLAQSFNRPVQQYPVYQPPPLRQRINCTSTTSGTTVFTNCN